MKGLEWIHGPEEGNDESGNGSSPLSRLSGLFRIPRGDIPPPGTNGDTGEPPPPVAAPFPGERLVDRYWLKKGFSYALVVENDLFDLLYRVVEPPVSFQERLILEEVHTYLRDVVVFESLRQKGEVRLAFPEVRSAVHRFSPGMPDERVSVLYYYLERNLQGYGLIDPLMHDRFIEDITCNGSDSPVYIYHNEFGSVPTTLTFTAGDLNRFVLKLSQKADKQVSIASPLLDAPLPDGSRAQITYTDVVSSKGSSFTIRRFKTDPMTPVDLIRYGTYSPEILAFIWLAVENRKSMIIVGGTASGKTSTMNAISYYIPLTAKIVSLEDTREIQLPHKNWLPTKTRETTGHAAKGDIDLFSLLRSSLRQRPEYIIVGEVRGPEAQTLFQAMNTGHTTYSTLHAGSVEESINRLVNPPINVPRAMFGALDLMVVQLLQYREGKAIRRCASLNEISVDRNDAIRSQELYTWYPRTDRFQRNYNHSRVLDSIGYARGWSRSEVEEQLAIRKHLLELMARKGITRSAEVSGVFNLIRKSERIDSDILAGEAGSAGS